MVENAECYKDLNTRKIRCERDGFVVGEGLDRKYWGSYIQ